MERGLRWAMVVLAAAGVSAAGTNARAAAGETCADAPAITTLPFGDPAGDNCGFISNVDNSGGGACADLPSLYPGPDVFYKLVLGAGNSVAFDLEYPQGATGDLALFLLSVPTCGGAATCTAYSIDVEGAGQGPERIKSASYPAGTYYVVVDSVVATGTPGSCGSFTLTVTGSLGTITSTGPDGGAGGGAGTAGDGGVKDGGGGSGGGGAGGVGDGGLVADAGGGAGAGGLDGGSASDGSNQSDGSSQSDAAADAVADAEGDVGVGAADGSAGDGGGTTGPVDGSSADGGGAHDGGSSSGGCACALAAGPAAAGSGARSAFIGVGLIGVMLFTRRRRRRR